MKDRLLFLFVHLFIPVIGILAYVLLLGKMKKEQVPEPPATQLFWLFGTYGVVTILIMTSLVWKWHRMASIGAFASISLGPIITTVTALSVYNRRYLSIYHQWTYWLSLVYIALSLLLISASILFNQ